MQPSYVLEIRYVQRPAEVREITASRVVIGREGGDIPLGDGQASAAHAEIEFENGQIVVRDLGSTNGTWLGDRQLPQFALSPGQSFRCGHTVFVLRDIKGGQQLRAGRTIMADASMRPPAAPPSAAATAPRAAAAVPAEKSSSAGLVIGLVAGVLVLGGLGAGGWYWHSQRQAKELAQAEIAAEDTSAAEPEAETGAAAPTSDLPKADEGTVDDMGSLYRQVGAATVVIRSPGSVGSGVVIGDDGLILTNHHVIDGGTRDGLNVKVKVVMGEYSEEMKTFEPETKQREAWVVKFDEEHDLALIRLIEPLPDGVEPVSVAAENPYPGQEVAAIGHAGAGMLWAIKGGEVSATGKLTGHTDLMLNSDEAGDDEFLRRMKRHWEKKGRVLQSTAKILPGDSGGPLVNLDREIVGINAFGRIDRATNQWLSFHVHLAEVKEFLATKPERPVAMVPNPWHRGGPTSKLGDADLDGTPDVLLLSGSPTDSLAGYSAFVDLDQDSQVEADGEDAMADIVDGQKFDAEFAALFEPGKRHFWYDTDNDGTFDLYLRDEAGRGHKTDAYRIDASGAADLDEMVRVDDGLSAELFSDATLTDRFGRVTPVMFPSLAKADDRTQGVPMLFGHKAGEIQLFDTDGDGTKDALSEETAFDQRYYLDLDQDALSEAATGDDRKKAIEAGTLDVEVASVRQGSMMWVWYDRDDDGKFDAVLQASDAASAVAVNAWKLAAAGNQTPYPDAIGRLLLRPKLFGDSEHQRRFSRAVPSLFHGMGVALDEGLGSFPSTRPAPGDAVSMPQYDGFRNAVALVNGRGFKIELIDLDGSSINPDASLPEASAHARSPAFDAEFAMVRHGSFEWSFYDRDDDGSFDLVVFSGSGTADTPSRTFEVDSSGSVTHLAGDDGKPMLRKVFERAELDTAFTKIAPKVFPLRPIG